MLDVTHLDFDYQDRAILKNVSFHLPAGGLLHLQGANGAGKTTLFKLIAGLYRPSQGSIFFNGQEINSCLSFYQQNLCFVGHKTGINPYLTLRENCQFDLHYSAQSGTIEELVALFKLDAYLDSPCGLLSAGQRRQVGLLRLWMTHAPLWLLDEPLVALDDRALALTMARIDEHRQTGGAVLLTSHQALPTATADYLEYVL
ncbi:MAG: heme ABC exporter ATP-binding protein CcmA [Legionella sp.]